MNVHKMFIAIIAIICMVDASPDASIFKPRPRKVKEEVTTEAAITKGPIKMLPTNVIKFIEQEKKPQVPLSSLFASGEKKPLMRKFVPRAKPKAKPATVSRRPLMKHRQFVIVPRTPKPQTNKTELFTSSRRKFENPAQKHNFTTAAVKEEDGDDYDKALNDDLTPAGSVKVYRKIIGDLRKRFQTKLNKPISGKSKYTYYIFKADDIAFSPLVGIYSRENIEKESDDFNEKEDKKEFIFMQKKKVDSEYNSSKKPTQSAAIKAGGVNDTLEKSTPISTPKSVNNETIFVQPASNVGEEMVVDVEANTTSNIPNQEDRSDSLPINFTPSVAVLANNTGNVVAETPSHISALNLPSAQSVIPKVDSISDVLGQSRQNTINKENKIDDIVLESNQSVTPKALVGESVLASTPSEKEGIENSLSISDSTTQDLEKTDVV